MRLFTDTEDRGWMNLCTMNVCESLEDVADMIRALQDAEFNVFDTETTGLRVVDDEIVALQFCGNGTTAYFIPTGMMDPEFTNLHLPTVLAMLVPLWDKGVVGHNIGYDWKMCQRYGTDFNIVADTVIESKLYDTYNKAGLKDLVKTLLKLDLAIEFKSLFPTKTKKAARRFDSVEFAKAVPYACQDVLAGWRLHQFFQPHLDPQHFIYVLEHDVIKPLSRMEMLGVRLDLEQMANALQEADNLMADLQLKVDTAAGRRVNLSSTQDIGKLLFKELGLKPLKLSEKTGVPSTDNATLLHLQGTLPIVDDIIMFRETSKIKVGFLKPLPDFVQSDGAIHPSFHQYGTATGRMSCTDPNLQQIPKEKNKSNDALRRAVRASILPPAGFESFLDIDYNQIEYRLFASLAQERALMQAFLNGVDVHSQTASIMLGIPLDQVDDVLRGKGKTLNFASIYGASKYRLSAMLGVSTEEADRLLSTYWSKLPNADAYCKQVRGRSRLRGYCETFFGRRRGLPYIASADFRKRAGDERKAVNTEVQGTAADLIKMAIVRADRALTEGGFKSRLVLTVHDQLVTAIHADDNLDEVANTMRWAMEITMPGWVPMATAAAVGPNWNDVEKYAYVEIGDLPRPEATTSMMTNAPTISPDESLTIYLDDNSPENLENAVRTAVSMRPGTSTIVLDRSNGSSVEKLLQGAHVDKPFLMQLRAENVRFSLSFSLTQKIMGRR